MRKKARRRSNIELIILIILCVTTIIGAAGWAISIFNLKGANNQLKQNNDLMVQMQEQIQELEERINTVEDENTTIKSEKEVLENEKADLETELKDVKTRLEDLKKEIDEGQVLSSTYYGPRPDKIVALTFDDGPGPYTDRLLNELTEKDVKATFFVLGNRAEKYPELLQRMYLEGHEIGNHSYDHSTLTNMTDEAAADNLLKSSEAIYNASGGANPRLVRPPGGRYNDKLQKICRENNWCIALWSLDTRDWDSRDEKAILVEVFDNGDYSVKDGSILLMHDIYETSINASMELIDRLEKEGYTFVKVSELLYWDNGGAGAGGVYN